MLLENFAWFNSLFVKLKEFHKQYTTHWNSYIVQANEPTLWKVGGQGVQCPCQLTVTFSNFLDTPGEVFGHSSLSWSVVIPKSIYVHYIVDSKILKIPRFHSPVFKMVMFVRAANQFSPLFKEKETTYLYKKMEILQENTKMMYRYFFSLNNICNWLK